MIERVGDRPLPTFVAFYTAGSAYKDEAAGLEETLKQFDLNYRICELPCTGNWFSNTQLKAEFLQEQIWRHKEPIVYVDTDARIKARPSLFATLGEHNCDFAAHYRPDKRFNKNRELLSGTMFLTPTQATRVLLHKWVTLNKEKPGEMDQRTLQHVIDEGVPGLRVRELPATYTKIFDIMRNAGPAVIEHYQASRRLRNTIK